MKKINMLVILGCATLATVVYTNQTSALPSTEVKSCWHGTIDSPFDDFLGIVPISLPCPEFSHPIVGGPKKHIEGDPNCQTTEMNPNE